VSTRRGPDSGAVAVVKMILAIIVIGVCGRVALDPDVSAATSIITSLTLSALLALVLFA
jgi:hypothetical protein